MTTTQTHDEMLDAWALEILAKGEPTWPAQGHTLAEGEVFAKAIGDYFWAQLRLPGHK